LKTKTFSFLTNELIVKNHQFFDLKLKSLKKVGEKLLSYETDVNQCFNRLLVNEKYVLGKSETTCQLKEYVTEECVEAQSRVNQTF